MLLELFKKITDKTFEDVTEREDKLDVVGSLKKDLKQFCGYSFAGELQKHRN